jgi:hypothetical protein
MLLEQNPEDVWIDVCSMLSSNLLVRSTGWMQNSVMVMAVEVCSEAGER